MKQRKEQDNGEKQIRKKYLYKFNVNVEVVIYKEERIDILEQNYINSG